MTPPFVRGNAAAGGCRRRRWHRRETGVKTSGDLERPPPRPRFSPGKRWNLVVTAPTLEQARWDLLAAFDERLFAMLREDLEPDKRGRPEGEMQAMRRSLGKNVQVRRKR